jgi:hypothetical protein
MKMVAARTDRWKKAATRRARRSRSALALWRIVLIAAAVVLPCRHAANAAENRVILLRGWLSVFSGGLDELAQELKAKGFDAEVRKHLYWTDVVNDLLREWAAGKIGTLTLVGHSQGGNDAVEIAYALELNHIPVNLIVALAPYYPKPLPGNVMRALDYYQEGGWGSPLTPGAGFHGTLANYNVANDPNIHHFNIDDNARIRAEVLREILAVPQAAAAPPKPEPPGRKRPPPARR